MAYPFVPMPTLADFIERVKADFGCKYDSIQAVVDGEPMTLRYLIRTVDGKDIYCGLGDLKTEQHLTPIVLESLCERLKIDPARFGLTLH